MQFNLLILAKIEAMTMCACEQKLLRYMIIYYFQYNFIHVRIR